MAYAIAFLGGLTGSLHCVGMCGGFPLALASSARGRNVPRQLLYNLGRLNTLAFLGALSGALGATVVSGGPARLVERALAVAAGTLMVVIGLEMLGVIAQLSTRGAVLVQATVGRLLSGVIVSRSPLAPLALGIANAFLPCQLIYAFVAEAAATASAGRGMLVMVAFGLGTVPAMLGLGLTRVLAVAPVRARLSLASGFLVVAFGALTIARGVAGAGGLGHLHAH